MRQVSQSLPVQGIGGEAGKVRPCRSMALEVRQVSQSLPVQGIGGEAAR